MVHGRTLAMERRNPVRARQRPDQGLRRRFLQADPLPGAPREGWGGARAQARVLQGGQGGPLRRGRARLRDLARPLRRPDQGRDPGAGARARQDDRPRRFRPGRPDRPGLLRHPYWLGPQKDSDDAYSVLVAALEKTGLVGIGRFALRTREQLVALYPVDGALRISTMRFHDEVVEPDDLDLPQPSKKVTDKEAKMADALVSSLRTEFDPAEYEDTYRERVLEVVEAKAEGKQIVVPQQAEEAGDTDLMALLEQSVSGARKTKKPKAKARKAKAKA